MERRPEAFAGAVPMDREPAVGSSFGRHMGEAKELERLRPALASCFSILSRKAAKFDQASFLGVELQSVFGEPLAEFRQAVLRLVEVLKPHHKVIRVPHDNHISTAAILPPPLNPQVEHVMQEHVAKDG